MFRISKLRTALALVFALGICLLLSSTLRAVFAAETSGKGSTTQSAFPIRSWTGDEGERKVEARFLSATDGVVMLLRRDGQTVTFQLDGLSERDQGYIEGLQASLARVQSETPNQAAATSSPPRPASHKSARKTSSPAQPGIKPYTGEAKELELPDQVGDVCRAAAGRLLLLHLPKSKKVAVYDVNEAKFVKYISLSDDSSVIAGGLTKMIVVAPNAGVIERWSLESFERETARPLPFNGVFKTMAMGYAADGPLLVHWAASSDALGRCEYRLFDISDFEPLDISIRGHNASYRNAVHIRASATGDTFGLWATSHSPQGMEVMQIVGNEMKDYYQHSSAGHIVPNFDGSSIVTAAAGVCTPELNLKAKGSQMRVPLVPSTHPKLYVAVPSEPGAQRNLGLDPFKGVSPTLHIVGRDSHIVNLPPLKLTGSTGNPSWTRSDFSLDKRVHYVVAANQLITIPFTNDRIVVQPFDFRLEMERAGIDYLLVTSVPPHSACPGQTYAYQLEVATNAGKPKFELNSGPKGMTVSQSGRVQWEVPSDYSESKTSVIITVATPDNQSCFETFEIACQDSGARPESIEADSKVKSPRPQARQSATAPKDNGSKVDSARPQGGQSSVAQRDARSGVNSARTQGRPSAPPNGLPNGISGVLQSDAQDLGLVVKINPEGIYRPLVPNPEFNHRGAALRPPSIRTPALNRPSPARARVRIQNKGDKVIKHLTISATNNSNIVLRRTVSVDALRGIGQLRPGMSVEIVVEWPIRPGNVKIGGGVATMSVAVTKVEFQ